MGLPPRSCAADAHHCIMVEVLGPAEYKCVARPCATTASSPRIGKSTLDRTSPIQACLGKNRDLIGADAQSRPSRRLNLNRPCHPLSRIHRKQSCHAAWPAYPAKFLNHKHYNLKRKIIDPAKPHPAIGYGSRCRKRSRRRTGCDAYVHRSSGRKLGSRDQEEEWPEQKFRPSLNREASRLGDVRIRRPSSRAQVSETLADNRARENLRRPPSHHRKMGFAAAAYQPEFVLSHLQKKQCYQIVSIH